MIEGIKTDEYQYKERDAIRRHCFGLRFCFVGGWSHGTVYPVNVYHDDALEDDPKRTKEIDQRPSIGR